MAKKITEKDIEALPPELKPIFDIVNEGGENGIDPIEFFEKLGGDKLDGEAQRDALRKLGELEYRGYIYKKGTKIKNKKYTGCCTHWFVVGKGESVPWYPIVPG